MKRSFILSIFSVFILSGMFAQDRYLEEVFTKSEIKVTSDVHYATNATILALLFNPAVNEFVPEPLMMDVYEPDPSVDTMTNRPVVMVVHGGDALPIYANNACFGDKTDSVTIATSMKLAKMGYVVVAPNYRLGWNPLATAQDAFLDGLVDASVRVQQDLKSCARWLRKNEAEDGNTYSINPNQIAIWGTASSAGTYSGFAAYINEIAEVQTPTFFVTDSAGNVFNTYNEMEAGDLEGLTVGMTAGGDTTNYINTPGYSSAFQLAALGSAISLDSGILDVGEPPMIMFGNPASPVTQFDVGPIQLPTTGQVVAFAQLSGGLIKDAVAHGLNDGWMNLSDSFTVAQQADPNFGAVEGWLPLYGDSENEYPWVHWDRMNCPVDSASDATLPGSDRDYALAQIDTMAGYFGVRACATFGLSCPGVNNTSIENQVLDQKLITLSPNPTYGTVRIESAEGQRIQNVEVYSYDGRLVKQFAPNATTIQSDFSALSAGLYSVRVKLNDGFVTKKLVLTK